MLRIMLLLLSFAISSNANAQNFIKKYHFGLQGLVFSDIIVDHTPENIILYGYGVDTTENNGYGFFIARLDTSGNLEAYDVHYLPNNEVFGYTPNRDLRLSSDGGYVGAGNSLTNNASVIAKFNNDLTLNFLEQYPTFSDSYIYDSQYIWEKDNSYYILGITGYLNGTMIPFVHKVNHDGSLIWTKKYQDQYKFSIGSGFLKTANNELLIYGRSYPVNFDEDTYFGQGWIIAIDTSGEEIWSWESDTIIGSELGLDKLAENSTGFVALHYKIEFGNGSYYKSYSGLTQLNQDKDVVWDVSLGTGQPYYSNSGSRVYDLAQTIDSNWVAVGELIVDSLNARVAWMVAVTPDGDSLWARTDTLQHVTGTAYQSGLHSLVVLPSGSIIAAGRTQHPNGRYYGLLIKTDPRGCIEPDCHPYMSLLSADDNADEFEFVVSPNPTSGLLRITCPGGTPFSAEVYDGAGRVLAANPAMRCGETLNVSALPSGQYFVRVHTKGSQTEVHSVIKIK